MLLLLVVGAAALASALGYHSCRCLAAAAVACSCCARGRCCDRTAAPLLSVWHCEWASGVTCMGTFAASYAVNTPVPAGPQVTGYGTRLMNWTKVGERLLNMCGFECPGSLLGCPGS